MMRNAFNELDQTVMLLHAQHEWPARAHFVFNSYKHWATLVIQNNDGTGESLPSKQGATQ
jgi:hypothetical protein